MKVGANLLRGRMVLHSLQWARLECVLTVQVGSSDVLGYCTVLTACRAWARRRAGGTLREDAITSFATGVAVCHRVWCCATTGTLAGKFVDQSKGG